MQDQGYLCKNALLVFSRCNSFIAILSTSNPAIQSRGILDTFSFDMGIGWWLRVAGWRHSEIHGMGPSISSISSVQNDVAELSADWEGMCTERYVSNILLSKKDVNFITMIIYFFCIHRTSEPLLSIPHAHL